MLEAQIRHAMHEHQAIKPRGFDSQRQRSLIHREIDDLLDSWLAMREVVDLEAAL